jgi:hypothetical protein
LVPGGDCSGDWVIRTRQENAELAAFGCRATPIHFDGQYTGVADGRKGDRGGHAQVPSRVGKEECVPVSGKAFAVAAWTGPRHTGAEEPGRTRGAVSIETVSVVTATGGSPYRRHLFASSCRGRGSCVHGYVTSGHPRALLLI